MDLVASRLKDCFTQYIEAREDGTKQDLIKLIVADRVRNGQSKDGLKYVILLEDEGWMKEHTGPPKVFRRSRRLKGSVALRR